ncbi:MAG: hypothetical protein WC605_05430, partial [Bacteroidales bacterium]
MIAILFIFCCIIDAQVLSQNKIDSLKNLFPGSDTREQVDILNELASIYAPVNFDSSIFYSAQAMRMATISGYAFGIGCSRLYTGNAYYYNLDFKNALISYLSAQTILEEGSHFDELGELCLMLGHINFFIMRSDVAVSYYHKAYDNFKEAGDDSSQADVLYALNMTYWRDGPVDSALAAGERFLNYTRKHHYRSFEAAALINLGMTVWDEKSLRYHDEALKIAKELENFRMVAIIYNNIASYHYEIPSPLSENNVNLNLSRHYYDLVLENAQKVKYYYNIRAMAYLGLAKIDIKEGFYDSAESNLGNCEKIFDSIAQFPDPQPSPIGIYAFGKIFESFITLRTKNEFYASRFELARKTGKPEDAINYQRLYFESG